MSIHKLNIFANVEKLKISKDRFMDWCPELCEQALVHRQPL